MTISKQRTTRRILHHTELELTDDHFCISFKDDTSQTSRNCKRDCLPICKEFCYVRVRNTLMLNTDGELHMPVRATNHKARRATKVLNGSIKVDLQKVRGRG
ncbi:unnamed protein product [Linum trigynum]|uniref:Uncharacterized protein n=1 Tax=Linum trigynum TaxID=586398 RepID=A0AAV2FVT2_9ROSI